jgi:DMSO reductase anchor subunit
MNSENKISTNLFSSFKNPDKLNTELHLRFIKMLDIGYTTVLYFIFAILMGKIFNYFFGKYNTNIDVNKSSFMIGLELCGLIWLMGISTYIARNIVELIPSPFENMYEYHHRRLKELGSAAVYTLVLYQSISIFRGKLGTFLEKTF